MKKTLKVFSLFVLMGMLFSCNTPGTSSSSKLDSSSTSSFSSTSQLESISQENSSTESTSIDESSSSESLSSSESQSNSESSSSSSEMVVEKKYSITGSVSNVFDGNLNNAIVKINDQAVTLDEHANFTINDLSADGDQVLTVNCEGYEDYSRKLNDLLVGDTLTIDLGTIDMVKTYAKVGRLVEKPNWNNGNYEAFEILTTRNQTGIIVKCKSANKVFVQEGRDARLEVYVSVKDIGNVRDNNVFCATVSNVGEVTTKNFGDNNIVVPATASIVEGEGIDVIVNLPYALLGIQNDEIIGISVGEWSESDKDWAPMYSLDSTIVAVVEDAKGYIRTDKNNYCFNCEMNCYPEDVPQPTYNKEELIQGYNIHTADPTLTNKPNSDDVYIKVNKNDTSFVIDMIGFGTFADDEFFKFIFHSSSENESGWRLKSEDIIFLVNKEKATKKTGITDFWAYRVMADSDDMAIHTPVYEANPAGYFTLQFTIDFSEIPNYSAIGPVSMFVMEFFAGNTTGEIYDANPFTSGMLYNGIGTGDPAAQSSYITIQEKYIAADKETLIKDKNIEFSKGGGDIYANVIRHDDRLTLNLISFNQFADNSFIRFIIHSASTNYGGWGLDSSDVGIVIYKNASYITIGKTGFWDDEANQFHGEDTTLYEVNYQEDLSGEYWTLSLDVDYTEIGQNITKDTALKALLIQFVGGGIQNNGFSQDGVAKGDVADQNNYFTI